MLIFGLWYSSPLKDVIRWKSIHPLPWVEMSSQEIKEMMQVSTLNPNWFMAMSLTLVRWDTEAFPYSPVHAVPDISCLSAGIFKYQLTNTNIHLEIKISLCIFYFLSWYGNKRTELNWTIVWGCSNSQDQVTLLVEIDLLSLVPKADIKIV